MFRDNFGEATMQVRDYIYDKGNAWISHPDNRINLVVMPYASSDTDKERYGKATLQSLHSFLIPFEQDRGKIDLVEDVIFFDHLQGFGSILWIPIIRKAITATPFGQEQGFPASFLIDGHITASSIGSPVLLIKKNLEDKCVLFLGIIIDNLKEYEPIYTEADNIPPKLIKQYENIGIVLNSLFIPELIEHAIIIYMERKESEKK